MRGRSGRPLSLWALSLSPSLSAGCLSLSWLSTPPWSMLRGSQVNTEPSCDILCPSSLLLLGPCYGGPRWIQSHLVPFLVLALYSSMVHVTGAPDEYRAFLWHSCSSLSTPPWSMLRGSQVNTEPSCAILGPRSLLLHGPCYGGPRWIQSLLVTFLFLALYSSSLVHVTGVPGEYRAILCHSWSSLSTPQWSVLWVSQANTEPSCDILCPRSLLLRGPCYGGPRWIQSHLVTFHVKGDPGKNRTLS